MALAAGCAAASLASPPDKGVATFEWSKDSSLVIVRSADEARSLPQGDFWIGVRANDSAAAANAAKSLVDAGLANRAFVIADTTGRAAAKSAAPNVRLGAEFDASGLGYNELHAKFPLSAKDGVSFVLFPCNVTADAAQLARAAGAKAIAGRHVSAERLEESLRFREYDFVMADDAAAAASLARKWRALDAGKTTAPPSPPGPESWTFRRELAEPITRHPRERFRLVDDYGVSGNLTTATEDLAPFLGGARELRLARAAVSGRESYRVEVSPERVTLTAEDDDGMRRAIYHFEDRVEAGDLAPVVKKPWLRNRITRCFFGPIKRAPYFRDELMDDIDYYPDAYLNRLAHEGVNGLWLTIEWRDIAKTRFTDRSPDAARRIRKLRRTVDKCLRYGIKTWAFFIEPCAMADDNPLLVAHPESAGARSWNGRRTVCPSSAAAREYMEDSMRDIFEQVPGLGGALCISHGERPTTCLSHLSGTNPTGTIPCAACSKREPWEVLHDTLTPMARGMRAANPNAELISWFYQPQPATNRAEWVYEVARHQQEGVTLVYNFESGCAKEQCGKMRVAGDYWLSFTGPAAPFANVARAAREAGAPVGAKIQVGCSHEDACVPFVPVPGLLYRKYRAMKAEGCTSVMQCWYFGNYPGVMNKAAGELAFEDFSDDEDSFLTRLARPQWGDTAAAVAAVWKGFSDAYQNYPLTTYMQYYGPFHFGLAWPLDPEVNLNPLKPTWKPDFPPAGDTIAECLDHFTLDEALFLAEKMASGVTAQSKRLNAIAAVTSGNMECKRDLGVMETLRAQFESARNAFKFYALRRDAVHLSRVANNNAAALERARQMRDIIAAERTITRRMIPLCAADSRLGFHSEAEAHQFFPAMLEWRLGELDRADRTLVAICTALAEGRQYPESKLETTAPVCRIGSAEMVSGATGLSFKVTRTADGGLRFHGRCDLPSFEISTYDAAGTVFHRAHKVETKDGAFSLELSSTEWNGDSKLEPRWLYIHDGAKSLWPVGDWPARHRLNLMTVAGQLFGRIK